MNAPAPEARRLQALAEYRAMDSPPEYAQDALTELAAEICGCPVALISLMDERRQWFKAKYGLPADFIECPREVSVCSTTLNANDLIYVTDLRLDARFKDLPTVAGEPHIRFYCGMPLINRDGLALGTLCVIDFAPRELTPGQREAVRRLAQQAMAHLELRRSLLERDAALAALQTARDEAERERGRAEQFLRAAMPEPIATELLAAGQVPARYHESVSILFADFREFTRLTEGLEPARLVDQLNQQFTRFDAIAAANRVETLKTMGDACLCVGGLTAPSSTHALDAVLAGLQFQKSLQDSNRQRQLLRLKPRELRVGINTGSLVAGVVGSRRVAYDVWGNAVNVAQRLEQACAPGGVTISASTYHHVSSRFETVALGAVEVRHLGAIDMFAVLRIRPEYAADAAGTQPSPRFWDAVPRPTPPAAS